MRLIQIKTNNYGKVKIGLLKREDDPIPCDACLSLQNKEYSIDQALEELPIPLKECKNKYCCSYYQHVV